MSKPVYDGDLEVGFSPRYIAVRNYNLARGLPYDYRLRDYSFDPFAVEENEDDKNRTPNS